MGGREEVSEEGRDGNSQNINEYIHTTFPGDKLWVRVEGGRLKLVSIGKEPVQESVPTLFVPSLSNEWLLLHLLRGKVFSKLCSGYKVPKTIVGDQVYFESYTM